MKTASTKRSSLIPINGRKRKRHNPEQIIRKLRSAERLLNQGQTVADVCRAIEVSAAAVIYFESALLA